jgi:hypothetical protein
MKSPNNCIFGHNEKWVQFRRIVDRNGKFFGYRMKCNCCGETMDFKNDFNLIGNQFNIEQKSDRFIFAIICNTIDESLQ